jgi:hypothetical protein
MNQKEWIEVREYFYEIGELVKCYHGEENQYKGAKDKKTGKPLGIKDVVITGNIHLNIKAPTPSANFLMIDFRRIDWTEEGERKPLLSVEWN